MATTGTTSTLLVAMTLSLLVSGCFTPFWEREDAIPETFMVFGVPASGRLGPTDELSRQVPFEGCFLVDVEDPANRGRVVADGYLDEFSRVVLRMEDFDGPNLTKGGGIGVNMPAAGQLPRGEQVLPSVPTAIAGWGNATIELNGFYLDDVFSGEYNFTSHFLLTEDGFVDDATGAIVARDGGPFSLQDPTNVRTREGDWEAHFVVHSHAKGEYSQNGVFRNRDDGGGMIVSDESYFREELFVVGWLGGVAEFDITVNGTTLIEAAQTSLTFRFFDALGTEVANTTIAPSGTAAASATERVEFATSRLGTYSFTVEGPAHGASYRVDVVLRAPESYQLHFLWEEKDEVDAVRKFDQCTRGRNDGVPVSGNANIARPPGLDLRVVALGVMGVLVAALLVVKLVVDSRKIDEFRAKFGKK